MRLSPVLLLVVLLSGCGGGGSPTSPTPAATAPTATALSIAGCLTADNFQCRGVATMSNNTTQDVTNQTQWSTSDSSIATISATGLLTLVRSGDVQVRASYQALSGTRNLTGTVTPPARSFTLVGVVATTSGQPISGAQVLARDRDGNNRTGTTDGNGFFSLAPLREGDVAVSVSASGYLSANRTVSLTGDMRMTDILMAATAPPSPPPPPTTPSSCNNGPYTWDSNPNVLRCRARNGQFAASACCGR